MYDCIPAVIREMDVLEENFPAGGTLIAEQNSKMMQKNEKHHDTVKNTNAHFVSGTDTAQEIGNLTDGLLIPVLFLCLRRTRRVYEWTFFLSLVHTS